MSNSETQLPTGVFPWLATDWLLFLKRLDADRLAHAVMITGPAGIGKSALASCMVARLLCRENLDRACGQCRSCQLLVGGAHPDYFVLEPIEESQVIKVDQVRDVIARLDLTTSISSRKVAYIHPAEKMNIAAANALLKSLEEPSGNTFLILVSSNPGNLPVTIRSRCQAVSIHQPDRQCVTEWLQDSTSKSHEEIDAALQAAGGSPLRAVRYLDSPDLDAFTTVRQTLATLLSRPGSVSLVSSQLVGLNPMDLWRWLSMCAGDAAKSMMTGVATSWLPAMQSLDVKELIHLQKQADINRQLATTPVRGDLLLQSWLIRWAEQIL